MKRERYGNLIPLRTPVSKARRIAPVINPPPRRMAPGFGVLTAVGLAVIGLLLDGCAQYQPAPLEPATTAARLEQRRLDDAGLKRFFEKNLGSQSVTEWPPRAWDPQALTLAAYYFHPDLEVARGNWRLAQAAIRTAGGRPNPTITLTPGYDFTTTVPSPWIPAVNFDLPLETAGKRGKRIAEATAQAVVARGAVATALWQVRSTLHQRILDFAIAARREAMLGEVCAAQSNIVDLVQHRVTAGAAGRSELLTAQVALSKSELDLADARLKRAGARPRLAAALGLSLAALDGVAFTCEDPGLTTNDPPVVELRRMALTGRSDLQAGLAEYAAAEAGLRLQIAKQWPDIHFSPGYQYDQGDSKWTLGIGMELPVLNQNQGPIAEAEARRKLAAAKFTALQAQVIAELDVALTGYQVARQQMQVHARLVTALREREAGVRAQFNAGTADVLEMAAVTLESKTAALVELDLQAQWQRARLALEDAVRRPLGTTESVPQWETDSQP